MLVLQLSERNGGQETTLIFQALDFLNMGCKVIGNGHDTTAQYGGTLVAGDIGKVIGMIMELKQL